MYILGIELKGNDAFLALVDANGKNNNQFKASLGDRNDAIQVSTFSRHIESVIQPFTITSVKLTRTSHVTSNANAIDIIKMEAVFQLLFPNILSIIDKDELEYWLSHHVVSQRLTNNYYRALGAAQFEQRTNNDLISIN